MEITTELLKNKYDEYNKLYFDNKLGKCKFRIINYNDILGTIRYYTSSPTIIIAKHPYGIYENIWTEEMLKNVLMHEMIHYYVTVILKPPFFLGCHSFPFRKVVNDIYKKYGYKVSIGNFLDRYKFLKKKKSLTFKERLEILYLKPLDYLLSWLL